MTGLLIATRNSHKVQEIRAILGEQYRYLTLQELPDAPRVEEDADTFAGNATKKAVELAHWLVLGEDSKLETRNSPAQSCDQKSQPLARPSAALSPSDGEIVGVKGVSKESSRRPQIFLDSSMEYFVLADDSGLEVDALNGAPGVHSARFAALNGSAGGPSAASSRHMPDAANNAKLLRLLKDVPLEKRTARFRCVLALTPVLPATQQGSSPVCYASDLELRTELIEGVCEGRIGSAPRGQGGFGYDPLFIPKGCQQSFAELREDVKNKLSHRAKALAELRERLLKLDCF